ncbi:hypothetical protein ABK040_006583 [Willaertia magna]
MNDDSLVIVSKEDHYIVKMSLDGQELIWKFGGSENKSWKEEGKLSDPMGIVIDQKDGSIYITNRGRNSVQIFSKDGKFIRELGGKFNETSVELSDPVGIDLDQEDICFGDRFILILDKFGKAFKVNALDSVVQIEVPSLFGSIKQIAYAYSRFYILNNNLLEYLARTNTFLDSTTFNYLNVKRIYYGFGHKLYFVACDINEEYLSVTDEFNYKDITELVTMNEDMERYLFPIIGYNFAYVVNTNNPNCFEESKEIERMKELLFKQLEYGHYCKNSFKDISILF